MDLEAGLIQWLHCTLLQLPRVVGLCYPSHTLLVCGRW